MPSPPLVLRGWPLKMWTAASAAPTAPPASPAAGWIQMFSNAPSRSTLPLATQLSATPPARHKFFAPVFLARLRVRRSTASSSTAWMEAATSMWNAGKQFVRGTHRLAEQRGEALVGHGQAGAIVEIRHVEPERAVRLEIDQIVEDELCVFRLAIGRESHDLVLAGVHLEAGVISERRIQQAK